MEKIVEFLKKYSNNEFKTRNGKILYNNIILMKLDNNFNDTVKFLREKYETGYGLKSMIKEFDLPVTYSRLRLLFDLVEIPRNHGMSVVTERLRDFRRNKAKNEYKNSKGFFKPGIQEQIKIKSTVTRGISGYYYNKSRNKYVWLRSSWEYIYAKWLDEKNIDWDVECKSYILKNGFKYHPDFFIFENGKLISIVEIKGYWKDKVWKFNELKNMFNKNNININLSIITNITPYLIDSSCGKEIRNWKKNRKLIC